MRVCVRPAARPLQRLSLCGLLLAVLPAPVLAQSMIGVPGTPGTSRDIPIPTLPTGPEDSLGAPSLQPGAPGSPVIFRKQERANTSETEPQRGVPPVRGPLLPGPMDEPLKAGGVIEDKAPPKTDAAAGGKADAPSAEPVDKAYGSYQRGYYVTAFKEASERLRANAGDAAAMTLLGELYDQGLGVAENPVRAAEWYRSAAKAGDPNAAYALAMMTLRGRGVSKNDADGIALLEAAAAKGHAAASYNLALIRLGAPGDKEAADAALMLRRAAEAEVPEAQYLLASLYRQGRGVLKDETEAAYWMQRAARNRLTAAQVEYAIMVFNGIGTPRDEVSAARMFGRAAAQGNAVAQNRYARLLVAGRGVRRNEVEAAGWHLLAAGQGLADPWLDEALKGLTPEERRKAEAFAERHRAELVGGMP